VTKRLLTIGHSYVVAANRRLAHEMALAGTGTWHVTAVAPTQYRGDLRPITVEPIPGEADDLRTAPVRLDRVPHLMWYGELRAVLDSPWDVVHCWEEPYVAAGAQIARGTPRSARLVVATFQNIDKRYPWPLSTFERQTMKRADGWIAFGRTVHDTLSTREPYAGKPSRVLSPGVDVERFRPDAAMRRSMLDRLGWSASDRVVGFLGRFVPHKGIAVLLSALDAANTPWRAVFVGGGPMERELRTFAQKHPGRVHIETAARHDEVPGWLNAMTILCAPSEANPRWREQFGRMLIEAMACGVPILASDTGEIPHVVGDAGMIAPERDVPRWTLEIDRLLSDDGLRRALSERGLERARSRFAWRVVACEHLTFFEEIVAGETT
jgi:glycosyltransferase involved in cell wall biosynthesis